MAVSRELRDNNQKRFDARTDFKTCNSISPYILACAIFQSYTQIRFYESASCFKIGVISGKVVKGFKFHVSCLIIVLIWPHFNYVCNSFMTKGIYKINIITVLSNLGIDTGPNMFVF